jgi:hypothetical protein
LKEEEEQGRKTKGTRKGCQEKSSKHDFKTTGRRHAPRLLKLLLITFSCMSRRKIKTRLAKIDDTKEMPL